MVKSSGLSAFFKTFSAKDESNEPSVALYRKGLNEFEKALQVPIPGHGLNQDKANELKSRIRRSVIQIKDWGPSFIFWPGSKRTDWYRPVLGSMMKERIHDLETGVSSQPKTQQKPCVPSRTNSKVVPSRPRPPGGQINNTNITVNRTVNKTVNKTVVNNAGTKQPSGLTSIPGIDAKMVERILAEKLEPTDQKME